MVRTFCYDSSLSDLNKSEVERLLNKLYKPLLEIEKESQKKRELRLAAKEGRKPRKITDDNVIPPYCILHDKEKDRMCITFLKSSKAIQEQIEKVHKLLKKSTNSRLKLLGTPAELESEVCEWWDKEPEKMPQGWKWRTLSHNGFTFPDLVRPYKPHGLKLQYGNQKLNLTPDEERVLMYYAKIVWSVERPGSTRTTDPTKDEVFNKNFLSDLRKKYLSAENRKVVTDLSKIKWGNFISEIKGSGDLEAEELYEKKCLSHYNTLNYGYAMVNGVREKIGNVIEIAGIFMGRGAKNTRGRIKDIVYPEDVTINIGEKAEIPEPPEGRKWKSIEHDHTMEWLGKYKDSISDQWKYIRLGSQGQFKTHSDYIKFETARELNKQYEKIKSEYRPDLSSLDSHKKQLATVLYLIEQFGLRPGGSGEQEEAGVAGATTLKVENFPRIEANEIDLDFIGKDSVRFFRTVKVDPQVAKNIKEFKKGKMPNEQVFNLVEPGEINEYIQSFNPLFSAKVFRTRLASDTMNKELKKLDIDPSATEKEKIDLLKIANTVVAKKLNHIKNQTKSQKEVYQKKLNRIKQLKSEIKKAKKEGRSTASKEKTLRDLESEVTVRATSANVAIDTSRKNYIDPRILIAWGLENDVPFEKIYNKAQQDIFEWAKCQTEEDWSYTKTPIDKSALEKAKEKKGIQADGTRAKKEYKGRTYGKGKGKGKTYGKGTGKKVFRKKADIVIKYYGNQGFSVRGKIEKYEKSLKDLGGKYNPIIDGYVFKPDKKDEVLSIIPSSSRMEEGVGVEVEEKKSPVREEEKEEIESEEEKEEIESEEEIVETKKKEPIKEKVVETKGKKGKTKMEEGYLSIKKVGDRYFVIGEGIRNTSVIEKLRAITGPMGGFKSKEFSRFEVPAYKLNQVKLFLIRFESPEKQLLSYYKTWIEKRANVFLTTIFQFARFIKEKEINEVIVSFIINKIYHCETKLKPKTIIREIEDINYKSIIIDSIKSLKLRNNVYDKYEIDDKGKEHLAKELQSLGILLMEPLYSSNNTTKSKNITEPLKKYKERLNEIEGWANDNLKCESVGQFKGISGCMFKAYTSIMLSLAEYSEEYSTALQIKASEGYTDLGMKAFELIIPPSFANVFTFDYVKNVLSEYTPGMDKEEVNKILKDNGIDHKVEDVFYDISDDELVEEMSKKLGMKEAKQWYGILIIFLTVLDNISVKLNDSRYKSLRNHIRALGILESKDYIKK